MEDHVLTLWMEDHALTLWMEEDHVLTLQMEEDHALTLLMEDHELTLWMEAVLETGIQVSDRFLKCNPFTSSGQHAMIMLHSMLSFCLVPANVVLGFSCLQLELI